MKTPYEFVKWLAQHPDIGDSLTVHFSLLEAQNGAFKARIAELESAIRTFAELSDAAMQRHAHPSDDRKVEDAWLALRSLVERSTDSVSHPNNMQEQSDGREEEARAARGASREGGEGTGAGARSGATLGARGRDTRGSLDDVASSASSDQEVGSVDHGLRLKTSGGDPVPPSPESADVTGGGTIKRPSSLADRVASAALHSSDATGGFPPGTLCALCDDPVENHVGNSCHAHDDNCTCSGFRAPPGVARRSNEVPPEVATHVDEGTTGNAGIRGLEVRDRDVPSEHREHAAEAPREARPRGRDGLRKGPPIVDPHARRPDAPEGLRGPGARSDAREGLGVDAQDLNDAKGAGEGRSCLHDWRCIESDDQAGESLVQCRECGVEQRHKLRRDLDKASPACTCGAPRGVDHGIMCPVGHSDMPDEEPAEATDQEAADAWLEARGFGAYCQTDGDFALFERYRSTLAEAFAAHRGASHSDYPSPGTKVRHKNTGQNAIVTSVDHRLSVELADPAEAAASAWYGRVWSARDVEIVK